MVWDAVGLGHVIALDLAPETSLELATWLPQGSLINLSWSQASPGAKVLFSSLTCGDRVITWFFYLCSLLIWPINTYSTELRSGFSRTDLVKGFLGSPK